MIRKKVITNTGYWEEAINGWRINQTSDKEIAKDIIGVVNEALNIADVVNWLPFTDENVSHYNRLSKEGKLIKLYDTGEQRHVNDDNFPMAVVTHYREG